MHCGKSWKWLLWADSKKAQKNWVLAELTPNVEWFTLHCLGLFREFQFLWLGTYTIVHFPLVKLPKSFFRACIWCLCVCWGMCSFYWLKRDRKSFGFVAFLRLFDVHINSNVTFQRLLLLLTLCNVTPQCAKKVTFQTFWKTINVIFDQW